jgi:hypothetical protein
MLSIVYMWDLNQASMSTGVEKPAGILRVKIDG